MANTPGVCNSFKHQVMNGIHVLGNGGPTRTAGVVDDVKAALYLASASLSPSTTTVYTTTGECSGSGYTAGGVAVTNDNAPSLSGNAGCWTPSASIVFPAFTSGSNVDTVLIYNDTQGDKAIKICSFTAQNPVSASLTLTMPANVSGSALLQIL
jgi:hypothetical protein